MNLIERIEGAERGDNSLDVLVEVAMFKPGSVYTDVRANNAGTKVIYTDRAGNDVTCWAMDYTGDPDSRRAAAAALRSIGGAHDD